MCRAGLGLSCLGGGRVQPGSLRHRLSLEAGEARDPEWSEHGVGSSHTPEGPSCCLGNAGQITQWNPLWEPQTLNLGRGSWGLLGRGGDGGHGLSFRAEPTRCVCTAGAPRRLVARGLRRPLSPEANSEAGQAWGAEPRCPTASAETVLPSQTPASMPSRCLALGTPSLRPGPQKPDLTSMSRGCQILNKTLTLSLAGRGLLGRAAQMTGEGETGSLIGWGGGHQALSRRWATLPRDPKGVGSLLTWCRLAFLSGLVGEAAER